MENYEEKYKEALENFKKIKNANSNNKELVNFIEYEYPKLRKSEDERIRKGLIKGLSAMRDIHKHQNFSDDAINIDDAIAWLEKQGEQKPALNEYDLAMIDNLVTDETCPLDSEYLSWLKSLKERVQPQPKQEWSEDDEKMCSQVINEIEAIKLNSSTIFEKNIAQDKIDWLKSIKDRVHPKQELSEEDEKIINDAIWLIEHYVTDGHKKLLREQTIDKLKSIKPNHWKPSEEQMQALFEAKLASTKNREYFLGLLYEDLKKL